MSESLETVAEQVDEGQDRLTVTTLAVAPRSGITRTKGRSRRSRDCTYGPVQYRAGARHVYHVDSGQVTGGL